MKNIAQGLAAVTLVLGFSTAADAGTLYMSRVDSIQEAGTAGGETTVDVGFTRRCGDRFIGLVTQTIPPMAAAQATVAVGVLMEGPEPDERIVCIDGPQNVTESFKVPAFSGSYVFERIGPEEDLRMAPITSIQEVNAENGDRMAQVKFMQGCSEDFLGVVTKEMPSERLAETVIATGVLVDREPQMCLAEPRESTTPLVEVPDVSGIVSFRPIAP